MINNISHVIGEILVDSGAALDYETQVTYVIQVNASDGYLDDVMNLTVTITDVNEPPSVLNLPYNITVQEFDSGTAYVVNASDPEGDMLFYSLDINPAVIPTPFTIDNTGMICTGMQI